MPSEDSYGFSFVNVAVTASQSSRILVANPGKGKRIVIDDVLISSETSTGTSQLTFKSGYDAVIGPLKIGNSPQTLEVSKRHFCNPGEPFVYDWNQSSTGSLNMNINYHIRG